MRSGVLDDVPRSRGVSISRATRSKRSARSSVQQARNSVRLRQYGDVLRLSSSGVRHRAARSAQVVRAVEGRNRGLPAPSREEFRPGV
jgi:hypothetical protein